MKKIQGPVSPGVHGNAWGKHETIPKKTIESHTNKTFKHKDRAIGNINAFNSSQHQLQKEAPQAHDHHTTPPLPYLRCRIVVNSKNRIVMETDATTRLNVYVQRTADIEPGNLVAVQYKVDNACIYVFGPLLLLIFLSVSIGTLSIQFMQTYVFATLFGLPLS